MNKKELHQTSHSCPLHSFSHFDDDDRIRHYLLDRSQEHLNRLLYDFLDAVLQASMACASLLSSIDHHAIRSLLRDLSSPSAFSELSSHLNHDNPLSPQNLSHFHHIHSLFPALILRLTSARPKIAPRVKLFKFTKKADGCLLRRLRRWFKGWVKLDRAKARVEAAAKGAYIIGKDLDTMSRMLRRSYDEVENQRDVARMVVTNREWETVTREVVKEMEGRRGEVGLGFGELLKELEEHVYLCLTTIDASSGYVVREMQEASKMA